MKKIFGKILGTVLLCLIIVMVVSEGHVVFAAKFSPGDIVEVCNTSPYWLWVRDAPAGNNITKKYDGDRGMIIGGPESAYYGGVLYTWWQIRWADDVGLEGWSAEGYPYPGGVNYLEYVSIRPSKKFDVGDFVKVYGTGGAGLKVRSDPPELARIGVVYDETTGKVIDGPFYGVGKYDPAYYYEPGFYYFWKIDYGSIVGWSAENWLTEVTMVGEPVITSSLEIVQSPPYYVADTITATFTITNKATVPFTFDVLTVGGRDPDGQVADFTWRTGITLNPSESYTYTGTLTLTKVGNYHFFCAYRTPDGNWNTAIPTESGVSNVLDITVEPLPTGGDFSISAYPTSLTIQQGSSATSSITITSINGFDQSVQLTISGAPSGVTATLNRQQVTPPTDGSTTLTLTVSVSASATPGSYTLAVTGTSGMLAHSINIYLEIVTVPSPAWSFAIITDLHIGRGYPDYGGEGTNLIDDGGVAGQDYYLTERLKNTVKWIIENQKTRNIKFVVVLGDISDSGEYSELKKAKDILDELRYSGIPYVPVIGNHDIWPYTETEEKQWIRDYFEYVFGEQFAILAHDPEFNLQFQEGRGELINYKFEYNGIVFVALDFNSRTHAYGHGVLPNAVLRSETEEWLRDCLRQAREERKPTILLSHHPFKPDSINAFSPGIIDPTFGYIPGDFDRLQEIIKNSGANILAHFAGHIHGFNHFLAGKYNIYDHFMDANTKYDFLRFSSITTEALMVGDNEHGKWDKSKGIKGVVRVVKVEDKKLYYNPSIAECELPSLNPYLYLQSKKYTWVGEEVKFEISPFQRGRTFKYKLDWGDGSSPSEGRSSTDALVTHRYLSAGNFVINLTVTDVNNPSLSESITRNIYVGSEPIIAYRIISAESTVPVLWSGANVMENPQNTPEDVTFLIKHSDPVPVATMKVYFNNSNEDIDLTTLAADVSVSERKSFFYMTNWPEVIAESKILYVPSSGSGAVYICFNAKSLDEVTLENADLIIPVGKTVDGITVTTTLYNGMEYYVVSGIVGTGGGEVSSYALTILANEGGTTYPSPRTYPCPVNSTVYVTAIPESGYILDYWELDSANVGSDNPYAVLMNENHTIKAVFSYPSPQLLTISGVVRDKLGNPVPNVLVVAQDASTELDVASDTSNATGAYAMSVPPGTYNLIVTPPPEIGFAPTTITNVEVTKDTVTDIVLVPAETVTFSGQLIDRDGSPLSNVYISVYSAAISQSTYTNESGQFSLNVPPDYYSLSLGYWNWTPSGSESFSFSKYINITENIYAILTLQNRYLTGNVIDPYGNPVANVSIYVNGWTSFDDLYGSFEMWTTTDNNGNFNLEVFTSPSISLKATSPPEIIYGPVNVIINVTEDSSVTVTLAQTVTFSGLIVNRDGNPVPNVYVSVYSAAISKSNYTDEYGQFTMYVPPDYYSLSLGYWNWTPSGSESFSFSKYINITQDTFVTFTLENRYLSGIALDPTGNSVANVSVYINGWASFDDFYGSFETWTTTDSEGKFNVTVFNSPSVSLKATPPPENPYGPISTTINVTEDTWVTITLAQTVTFSGQVLDRDGEPIPNVYVSLYSAAISRSDYTDDQGLFSLNVPPDYYSLSLGYWNWTPSGSESFSFSKYINITENIYAILTLQNRYLTGKVDVEGKPVANVSIYVNGWTSFDDFYGSFEAWTITDSAGKFNVTVFTSSSVTIKATPPPESIYAPTSLTNIDVTNDKMVLIALFYKAGVLPTANFTWSPETPETGQAVTFDASSSVPGSGIIIRHKWSFGDGTYAVGRIETHTYSSPGVYTVTLNVTNSKGLWSIIQKQIEVVELPGPKAPIASFTYTPVNPTIGQDITFNASDSHDPDGTIVSYNWDFGDGSTAEGMIVLHSYAEEGSYKVTLTVVDNDGKSSNMNQTVTVVKPLEVPVETSGLIIKAMSSVDLIVIDPDYLVICKEYSEIPSAVYMEIDLNGDGSLDDYVFIPEPKMGQYMITVIPEPNADPTATYTIVVATNDATVLVAEDVPISDVPTEPYVVVPTTFEDPPTTQLTIGEPKYIDPSNNLYVTSETTFILEARDNPGGSGVNTTFYRISNDTYSTDWLIYTEQFKLTGLADGVYNIEYKSMDNAGNAELINTATVILFSWQYVYEDAQRGTTLKINTNHSFFQFITPDKDYGIRQAAIMYEGYVTVYYNGEYVSLPAVIIRHNDSELRLLAYAGTEVPFCYARAVDYQTGNRYMIRIDPSTPE